MADVNTGGDGGGGKHSKKRAKKTSTHIDMTPMVDLAFLLLTFFVLTSTFSKPTTMEITMPVDEGEKKKVFHALTILLMEDDEIYYYYGELKEDGSTQVNKTSFDPDKGIRKILIEKNRNAIDEIRKLKKDLIAKYAKSVSQDSLNRLVNKEVLSVHRRPDDQDPTLTVIIKADPKCKYGNVVEMIDEMSVAEIGKYALVDISPAEKEIVETIKSGGNNP
jgi:biopolymer transport protein ExbD